MGRMGQGWVQIPSWDRRGRGGLEAASLQEGIRPRAFQDCTCVYETQGL